MTKPLLTSALLALFITSTAWADKPEWAGEGKPTAEQKNAYKAYKGDSDDRMEKKTHKDKKEKMKMEKEFDRTDQEDLKVLDKQRTKKSAQVQKELGRGSEQGQESREGRRKWWKFWDE